MAHPYHDRYVEACNYPGRLDPAAVERSLDEYCKALKVERKIVRIERGWTLDNYPELDKTVDEILADFAKRAGGVEADPGVTPEVKRAARHRFAAWCIYRRWWVEDMSWLSTTYLGAKPGSDVEEWSKPTMEAFLAGCWIVYWTDSVLYWVAKPKVYVDDRRRLHREDGPACDADVSQLYFLEGQYVEEHVVMRPDEITVDEIRSQENAETKRILRERYGISRYLRDTGAKLIDVDYEGARQGAAPRALMEDHDGQRWLIGTDGSTTRVYEMGPFEDGVKTCRQAHEIIAGFSDEKVVVKS